MELPRILARLDRTTDCWLWPGAHTSAGYGVVRYQGRIQLVHRVVYAETVGPIGEGLHLDHECEHRACANPEHLAPVTIAENNARSRQRGRWANQNSIKGACPRCGGPFTQHRGERVCLPCRAAYLREWRARRAG